MGSGKETIHVGPITIKLLVTAQDSGGTMTMFECGVPSNVRVPAPHSHDAFEETIYGLRGRITFTVDGNPHQIGPGDATCVHVARYRA